MSAVTDHEPGRAELEEERDFLLRSLEDLEREHAAGDVDETDYVALKDGYAVRYKLLRNGKRQILNVILPGDIIGLPGSFYERAAYSVTAVTDLRMNVCSLK